MLAFILSLFAGFFQTFRNSLSKKLSTKLSSTSVTFPRFFFAIPVVIIYILILIFIFDLHLGEVSQYFWYFLVVIVFTQIIANTLLVYLFDFEFFAVSVAFSKMEVVFVAIIGSLFFADDITFFGWILVVVSILGVVILSIPKFQFKSLKELSLKPIFIGILAGLFFAISTVAIKEASVGIIGGDLFLNVAFVLLMSILIQSLVLFIYIMIKNKNDLKIMFQYRYNSLLVGVFAALGSICWFSAYSLISPALVKTIGSVEMVFTVLIGYIFFKDRLSIYEYIGIITIVMASIGVLYA